MLRRYTLVFLVAMILLITNIANAQFPGFVEEALDQGAQNVALGDVLLNEPFTGSGNWESVDNDDAMQGVVRREYRLRSNLGTLIWAMNEQEYGNVVIEIETKVIKGDFAAGYGIICRGNADNTEGYYFGISSDGMYSIGAVSGESFTSLVDWDDSEHINRGIDQNTLIVVCVDDYLAMYANGDLLGEVYDSTYSEGLVGMMAFGTDDNIADVAFDDFTVWGASISIDFSNIGNVDNLRNYDGDWEDTIAELEGNGMIGSGGNIVFVEDHAFFEGQGYWFTPMGIYDPYYDVVMAGELTFSIGHEKEFEMCNLTARIQMDPSYSVSVNYVDVGFTNEGVLVAVDRYSDYEDANFVIGRQIYDLTEPHHLVFLLQNDKLTVYVNGKLAIEDFQVEDRAGIYGLSLIGAGPDARCDGHDIWVYQSPSVTPGLCEAIAYNRLYRI